MPGRAGLRFGRARQYSQVTLEDHLKHLVWTSAHGGRHDEESEKPIVSTNEVTQAVLDDRLIVPIITIQLEGRDVYGAAWYAHDQRMIFAIAVCLEAKWATIDRVPGLPSPAIFVSVPAVLGRPGVRFLREAAPSERAIRIDQA